MKIAAAALVILLAAFLRFYNLNELYLFTIDEEYLTTFAQTIVEDFHVLWIGMSISNGFYLGPLLIYITAFFLSISGNNPIFLAYVAAGLGVLSALLVFLIGRAMFGYKVGLISSLLYAAMPLIVFFDQRYWNDTPVIFLSLLMLFSIFKAQSRPFWWIVFAASIGFMFHSHLSIFPYLFIAAFFFFKQFRKIPKKIIALSFAVFLAFYSPLLVFDYFHNWDNLSLPLRLIRGQHTVSSEGSLSDRSQVLFQTFSRVFYLSPNALSVDENHWGCTSLSKNGVPTEVDKTSTHSVPPIWLSTVFGGVLIFYLINKKTWKKPERKILAVSALSLVAAFLLFSTGALEYYLLGLFPLLLFIPAILIFDLPRFFQKFGVIVVIILVGLGIFTVLNTNASLGIGPQREIVRDVMQIVGNNSFELKELGGCRGYAGWRYLFFAFGKAPDKASIDSTYGWLYPGKISTGPTTYSVIIVESRALPNVNYPGAVEIKKGGFKAFVLRNE